MRATACSEYSEASAESVCRIFQLPTIPEADCESTQINEKMLVFPRHEILAFGARQRGGEVSTRGRLKRRELWKKFEQASGMDISETTVSSFANSR